MIKCKAICCTYQCTKGFTLVIDFLKSQIFSLFPIVKSHESVGLVTGRQIFNNYCKSISVIHHRGGASNRYWLTFGQSLLSLQQVRVEGECFYFFCFFTVIHFPFSPVPLFHLLYHLFYLFFAGRRDKMTHQGWRVVKPQHNQSFFQKVSQYCCETSIVHIQQRKVKYFPRQKFQKSIYYRNCIGQTNFWP